VAGDNISVAVKVGGYAALSAALDFCARAAGHFHLRRATLGTGRATEGMHRAHIENP
jgi:hypothetical protein